MAIKTSLNKLDLETSLAGIMKLIEASGFITLPITKTDILKVAELPFYHRDPFDRLIISQAFCNNLTIITKDAFFKDYQIPVIW